MKNLKFLLAALLIIGLGVFAAACSSDNDDPKVTLSVSPKALSFEAAGGEQALTVTTASKAWSHEVGQGATWLTATKSGDKIAVVAAANDRTAERTATITVKAEGATNVVVNVTQAAAAGPTLSVNPSALEFTADAGEQTLTITTSVAEWTHEQLPAASWLTITKTGATLKVAAAAYTATDADRTAIITVKAAGATSVTVNVTQLRSGAVTSPYDDLVGKYSITGTPKFFEESDVSAWSANLVKVTVDMPARLIELYGSNGDLGFEPNVGSKYLELSAWGSRKAPYFLEYTSDDKVAFPEVELFINASNQFAIQMCIGQYEDAGDLWLKLLEFENNRMIANLDLATKTISLPATVDLVVGTDPLRTYELLPVIVAFDASSGALLGGFGEGYQSIKLVRSGPVAAPEYQGAPMPSRLYNLANSPYREVNVVNPEAIQKFLKR